MALHGVDLTRKRRTAGLLFEKAMWIEFFRLPIFWSEYVCGVLADSRRFGCLHNVAYDSGGW